MNIKEATYRTRMLVEELLLHIINDGSLHQFATFSSENGDDVLVDRDDIEALQCLVRAGEALLDKKERVIEALVRDLMNSKTETGR